MKRWINGKLEAEVKDSKALLAEERREGEKLARDKTSLEITEAHVIEAAVVAMKAHKANAGVQQLGQERACLRSPLPSRLLFPPLFRRDRGGW